MAARTTPQPDAFLSMLLHRHSFQRRARAAFSKPASSRPGGFLVSLEPPPWGDSPDAERRFFAGQVMPGTGKSFKGDDVREVKKASDSR